jgi:DNA polymerase-3 subunit gamma/tau
MSYQVLARKWRPQNFAQLVGQDHVKAALTNALSQNRLHHAYLFTGTRGVGKTTIARIFAKSLNCEKGVTATPCGVCSACTEIDKGYFVDLLEIDAASRTKVEDTRDLLDNVQYAPSRGRYKVYLIDEVHMLSKHSFNALLKTLEEPPPHVKFLLATTDPQKLPITVLSRCLQFSLKALSQSQIKQHLSYILGQEQIEAEDEALALLARAAKGSLRDSLSLTDQAIAQTNGQIMLAPVREMLGLLEQSWAELLLQDVLNRDLNMMQQHLMQLIAQHSQYQSVLDDMLSLLHLAALCQFQLNAAELALTESAFVRAVAKSQPAELIQLYYQLLLSGKKDLTYAPDQRIGLEMALLRAIAFVPASGNELPQQQAQSGRAAALSAAGIPGQTAAVATASVQPQIQPQIQPQTPMLNTVQPLQETTVVSHTGVSDMSVAEHKMQLTQAEAAASPQHAVAENNSNEATAAVDLVTASILARRGMSATLPVGGVEHPKKSERQAAPDLPSAAAPQSFIASPLAPQSAGHTATAPVQAEASVDAVPADIQKNSPLSAARLQPAITNTVTAFAEAQAVQRAEISADKLTVAKVAAQAVEDNLAVDGDIGDDEDEPGQKPLQHFAAVTSQSDLDEEPDPVADSAGGDWAWQQYQTEETPSAAPETAQEQQLSQVMPIRHQLLDSLQVIEENTDFSAELIEQPELSAEALGQVMEFDGVIGAHNFAVRFASQVDSWAARIDQLAIGGLMRLFLLHASPQLQDNQLLLKVSSSQRHLDNEKNRLTLAKVLSGSFGTELTLTVEFAELVPDCPLAIQQRIDEARRVYVTSLLSQDPLVLAMQQQFDAHLLLDSLTVS